MSAVTLPLLKLGMRNSVTSSRTDFPDATRDRSQNTSAPSTTTAATKSTGMMLNPPRLIGASSVAIHHP